MIPAAAIERVAIDAALNFANLQVIVTTAEVEALFFPLAALAGGAFQVIPAGKEVAYRREQKRLREWLSRVARWGRLPPIQRRQLELGVQRLLGRTVAARAAYVFQEGRLTAVIAPILTGVQASYAFATALLIDADAGRWHRVKRCDLQGCPNWFFDSSPTRPMKFCSTAHAARARKGRPLR